MKKLPAVLLCTVLALILFACGAPSARGALTVSASRAKEDCASPSDPPEAADADISDLTDADRGVYENAFFNFGFALSTGQRFSVPDASGEGCTCILYVTHEDSRSLISVMAYETAEDIPAEEYAAAALDGLEDELSARGMEHVRVSSGSFPLAGEDRPGVFFSGTVNGLAVYTRQLFLLREDQVAAVSLTSYGEDTTSALAEQFYSLGK